MKTLISNELNQSSKIQKSKFEERQKEVAQKMKSIDEEMKQWRKPEKAEGLQHYRIIRRA